MKVTEKRNNTAVMSWNVYGKSEFISLVSEELGAEGDQEPQNESRAEEFSYWIERLKDRCDWVRFEPEEGGWEEEWWLYAC
jgi:hypothetical protein